MTFNLKKKYLFLIAICLIFFITKSSWNGAADVIVFKNGNADVYFGQFFKPQESFKVKFSEGFSEKGDIVLKRDGKNVKPTVESNPYRFFDLLIGDNLCNSTSCRVVKNNGFLVQKDGSNNWWSTQFARINGYETPINRTFSLQSTNAVELLFVKTDFRVIESRFLKAGVNNIHLDAIPQYETWRLVYAAIFSFCCVSLFFLFYCHRKKILTRFSQVPIYSIILAIVLIVEYLAVFPGIFSTDTVVKEISDGIFSTWYSPAFMVFNRLIACLYPDFIQIPEIIVFYVSSVYLASLLKTVRYGRVVVFFLLLLQIILPALFVSIFVQQRISLAAITIYAAIIFACGNIFEREKITPLAYGFLIFSALLRPEYWLIFLIFLLNDAWRRKNITSSSTKPIAFTFVGAICCYLFITYPLTWIQGVTPYTAKLNYQLVSLLDMSKPYVDCNNKNDILSRAIDNMGANGTGGLQEYCSLSPEQFFWIRTRDDNTIIKANNTIKRELFSLMLSHPKPAIRRIVSIVNEMALQDYWQIYDRYSNQTKEITSYHIQSAERFGLVKNYWWQSKLHKFIVPLFLQIANYLNVFVFLIFMMLLVPVISRCWLTIVINASFLFMTFVIGFAAPVAQWNYLIFIPIWSLLIIPIDILLFSSKTNLQSKYKLKESNEKEEV